MAGIHSKRFEGCLGFVGLSPGLTDASTAELLLGCWVLVLGAGGTRTGAGGMLACFRSGEGFGLPTTEAAGCSAPAHSLKRAVLSAKHLRNVLEPCHVPCLGPVAVKERAVNKRSQIPGGEVIFPKKYSPATYVSEVPATGKRSPATSCGDSIYIVGVYETCAETFSRLITADD